MAAQRETATLLLFARQADEGLRGRDPRHWNDELEKHLPELAAAFDFSIAQGRSDDALALATTLAVFFRISGRLAEGRDWLARAVDSAPTESALTAMARYENGMLAFWQDLGEAGPLLQQSLEVARQVADPTAVAVALAGLARLALREEDLVRAQALCEEALAAVEGTDETLGRGNALHVLGVTAQMRGDLPRAREVMAQRITVARADGNLATLSTECSNLSMVERQLGHLAEAEQLSLEALHLDLERGDEWAIPYVLNGMAALAVARGAFVRAATLLGAAETLQARQGAGWPPDEAPHFAHSRDAAAAALDTDSYAQAWSAGQGMSTSEAVRFAGGPLGDE